MGILLGFLLVLLTLLVMEYLLPQFLDYSLLPFIDGFLFRILCLLLDLVESGDSFSLTAELLLCEDLRCSRSLYNLVFLLGSFLGLA